MNIIGKYKNGNYIVTMLSDGTKIRETNDDEFIPSFAENCDVKITDKCDGGCPFCYEGCTPNGRHGDIMNYKFLDTLHPYTELAINAIISISQNTYPKIKDKINEINKHHLAGQFKASIKISVVKIGIKAIKAIIMHPHINT